jgi:hypothetical protein
MSAIAYLFVVVDYLRAKKNFRPDVGTGVASDAAIDRALTRLLSLLPDGCDRRPVTGDFANSNS